MKSVKNADIRLFTIAAAVAALVSLAGCGSGGGSSPTPTVSPIATPSPSPSGLSSSLPSMSDTGVTTRVDYTDPNLPSIVVTFPSLSVVGFGTSAWYHVYRNDVIVSETFVFSGDTLFPPGNESTKTYQAYVDTGFARPIDYVTIGALPTQVVKKISPGVPAFSADTPIVYRITLLTGTLDKLGQTTYIEKEVGRSNPITPFR